MKVTLGMDPCRLVWGRDGLILQQMIMSHLMSWTTCQ